MQLSKVVNVTSELVRASDGAFKNICCGEAVWRDKLNQMKCLEIRNSIFALNRL